MSTHLSAIDLSTYLDAEVGAGDRARIEHHLDDCPTCRHRLGGLQRVTTTLARLERTAPPSNLGARVRARAASAAESQSLVERLEATLTRIGVAPSIDVTFALVITFAVIILVFVSAVARFERAPHRVLFESPVPHESTWIQSGGVWWEQGTEGRTVDEIVGVADPRTAALLETRPDLGPLLELGGAVVVEVDGRVWRIEPVLAPGGDGLVGSGEDQAAAPTRASP